MEQIVISPTLDIRRSDLMLKVDFRKRFTLRDLMRASVSSSEVLPIEIAELTRCQFVQEFWDEANNTPYCPLMDGKVRALQLTYVAEVFRAEKKTNFTDTYWSLCGILKNSKSVSIEMNPTYRLSDLPIVLSPNIEYREFNKKEIKDKFLSFCPQITLLELFHAIFWHLSLFGSPESREQTIDKFVDAMKSLYLRKSKHADIESLKKTMEEQ